MDFEFTAEQREFREEVHRFLEEEPLTKKAEQEWSSGFGAGPYTKELWRKLGERRWICPHWPREYGGLELSHTFQYIVEDELTYFGIRGNAVAARMAGPIILRYGRDDQKQEFLPRIARGEIEFALGYTEPHAGSDLASIELRAEDHGDYFLLNGQKMFNTACHYADYHWLMARTEVTTPKHRGLSYFIVDLKSPGISFQPIWVLGGDKGTAMRTNAVFYDNVKVPRECMVGEKNRGFYMLMESLAYERISPTGELERRLDRLVGFIKETGKGKDPLVRQKLAELRTDLEVLKLLGMKICWMLEHHNVPDIEAALAKVYMCKFLENLANLEVDVQSFYGLLHKDSKWAVMEGDPEWLYRNFLINRITRGTPEIMWNIVAQRGLGLPRETRA